MTRAALIGCGRISVKHIEAFVNNAASMRLEASCDPLVERTAARAAEYQKNVPGSGVRTYADYRTMLAELKPDLVTIAAESGKHKDIALDCLSAGCHVICEKPMALSTADADAMIAAAKKAGKKLAVCFQNRFNAPVQKLRAALEAGRFG
ncbi:MAG: Gfo/Idh/MocA family oxidoreductase, partial [Treponema sp.]|nr:Gfo/Idh/MocA family oxidoreductase [Treponema sp.]